MEVNERVPVQGDSRRDGRPEGTIAWTEHQAAYVEYARRFGTYQSAERIAERGGFSRQELFEFLGHEPTTFESGGYQAARARWSTRKGTT